MLTLQRGITIFAWVGLNRWIVSGKPNILNRLHFWRIGWEHEQYTYIHGIGSQETQMWSRQHTNKCKQATDKHCVQRACKGNFIVTCQSRQTKMSETAFNTPFCIDRSPIYFSHLRYDTSANEMVTTYFKQTTLWLFLLENVVSRAWTGYHKTWPHRAFRPSETSKSLLLHQLHLQVIMRAYTVWKLEPSFH